MMKVVAGIILVGVAVGFSGVLGGGSAGTTEEAAEAAYASATESHAAARGAAAAVSTGPTPEICSRILTEFANGHVGDPEDRNQPPSVAAVNHARQVEVQRRLETAGCTSAYMDANGEAIMELVNRGRSPSEQIR